MKDSTIKFLACLAAIAVLSIAGVCGFVAVRNHQIDAVINQQTEVQKTRIIQDEKSERANTHLQWLPWN